jgi:predicted O-methyltransferase YrrM
VYSPFQLAKKYIRYYLTASNGKGHGVHSPFVFDFIENILNDKRQFYAYNKIENLRNLLKNESEVLEVEDFGAGSVVSKTKMRSVKEIAKSALKPVKFGQLFFRMVDYYQSKNILELGTSLGITSSYLALANTSATVTTMEGSKVIAQIAKQNFTSLGIKNIHQILGNFDDTLPTFLSKSKPLNFVFIDGNHRKLPTLNYFNQLLPHLHNDSIVIFDDVHWSEEMEEAWEIIKQDERVRLTIDLFFIGIVFFKAEFKVPQHFSIRF